MITIRKNVFETNSSSTHSICISKKPVTIPNGTLIRFSFGEYGWENTTVYNTANYLYTAITALDDRNGLNRLKETLDKWGVKYEFEKPLKDEYGFLVSGYIDHVSCLCEFVQAVLSDEDLLARYLFGDSFINTGNDNQDGDYAGCDIACEEIYDWDTGEYKKNPYHDEENYDYFEKGN